MKSPLAAIRNLVGNSSSSTSAAEANMVIGGGASTPFGVGAPPAASTALSPAQNAEMTRFLAGPIKYMQQTVVRPTSVAPIGAVTATNTVLNRFINKGNNQVVASADVSLATSGAPIRYMCFKPEQGYVAVNVRSAPTPGYMPIYFLPWQDQMVVELSIPPISSGHGTLEDDAHPRFFFTSGLSGCSVFVKGNAASPTVYHAGVSNNGIQGDSDAFWREQMTALNTGYDTAALKSLVASAEYLDPDRTALQDYLRWLNAPTGTAFSLEILECTACVFGIRLGRFWTFYLQEHIVSNVMRVVDRSALSVETLSTGKSYRALDNNKVAEVTRTRVPRHFGPFRFGSKVNKSFKITESSSSVPIGVREIFPRKSAEMLPNEFRVRTAVS